MTQSSDLATRHLIPDPEGARAQAAMVNGAQQVTADVEEIQHDTEHASPDRDNRPELGSHALAEILARS